MSRTIQEVVARYPCVRLATDAQGAELSEFLRSQMMSLGSFSVGFDRGCDFFRLLKAHSDQYWVFNFHNSDGSLVGLASLSRRNLRINGRDEPVGYFGDLRLDRSAQKDVRMAWRGLYEAVIAHIEDPDSPEHCYAVYTAILEGNIRGLDALTRSLHGVVYHEWKKYVNLAVFHPFRLALPRMSAVMERFSGSGKPSGVNGRVVDLGEMRTLVLRNPRWPQRIYLSFLSLLRGSPRSVNADAWNLRMRAITEIRETKTPGLPNRIRAYSELIRTAFAQPEGEFDYVLITLSDFELSSRLLKIHPFAYQITGILFEVTSPGRACRLREFDFQFEGAYL